MRKIAIFILFCMATILLVMVAITTLEIITKPKQYLNIEVKVLDLKPTFKSVEPPKKLEPKEEFLSKITPAVVKTKSRLDKLYERAKSLVDSHNIDNNESQWLDEMMKKYSAKDEHDLLLRMRTHPVSLVIAQAALETGWGSSRFYKEANNSFGIWSYDESEPRLRASETRGSKEIFVRKYRELNSSIEDYFHMIASGYAYRDFRDARAKIDNVFELLGHLRFYSELRDEYVARLYYVLKANRLYELDEHSKLLELREILPEYVKSKEQKVVQSVDEVHIYESELLDDNSSLVVAEFVAESNVSTDQNSTTVESNHSVEKNSTLEIDATPLLDLAEEMVEIYDQNITTEENLTIEESATIEENVTIEESVSIEQNSTIEQSVTDENE